MLKRLYIDNYKSLANFELKPDSLCLLMGGNGTGKTAIFQVLSHLKALILDNERVADAFPVSTLTRWDKRNTQTVSIEVEIQGHGVFFYYLYITHDKARQSSRISLETLQYNGKFLFQFEEGKTSLYDDTYRLGAEFYSDTMYAGLGKVVSRPDNTKLTRFLQWVTDLTCVTIDPTRMNVLAEKDEDQPSSRLENIASWFRHLSLERMEDMDRLKDALTDVIGLTSFSLRAYGPTVRQLNVSFPAERSGKVEFSFDELSDGQRALVALYALLLVKVTPDGLLFIDEPDNFVTLRELQPWLAELQLACEDHGAQAILVSHSAEVINYMASSYGVELRRFNNGPTTQQRFQMPKDLSYTPAEAIAMGAVA